MEVLGSRLSVRGAASLVALQSRFRVCFSPSPSVSLCLCGECPRPWHDKASSLARGALAASTLVRIHHRDTEAQRGTENSQITHRNDLENALAGSGSAIRHPKPITENRQLFS